MNDRERIAITLQQEAANGRASYHDMADAVLSALDGRIIPELPEPDETLVDAVAIVASCCAPSKGAARRLIAQGAVHIEGNALYVGKRSHFLPDDIRNALEADR